MGQKDIAEKLLEDYNDVFADIINVLLFNGTQVIQPDSLKETKTKSQYKASDAKLHEYEKIFLDRRKSENLFIKNLEY